VYTSASHGLVSWRQEGADVVVLTLPLDDGACGVDVLRRLREDAYVPIVVVGSDDSLPDPPAAYEIGATFYVPGPDRHHQELLYAVGLVLDDRHGLRHPFYREDDPAGPGRRWRRMRGDSPAMQEVFAWLQRTCRYLARGKPAPILLTGETGTGKDLLAACVHDNSARRHHRFVSKNCAAIPAHLAESQLFGHAPGAFTGARSRATGLFEEADGGTLLLNEIDALSLDMQAKLLSVVERQRVRPVGADRDVRVDVQLVAATNADLQLRVREGCFRSDLYHRLSALHRHLPPLRERGSDRLLLARSLLRDLIQERGLADRELGPSACRYITKYHWPGNVRELRNCLERALLSTEVTLIEAEHLKSHAGGPTTSFVALTELDPVTGAIRASTPPEGLRLDPQALAREVERAHIERVLRATGGNVSRAAPALHWGRGKLVGRMRALGLSRHRRDRHSITGDQDSITLPDE